jgi:hypothetical protein
VEADDGTADSQHGGTVIFDECLERCFGHIRQTRQAASA